MKQKSFLAVLLAMTALLVCACGNPIVEWVLDSNDKKDSSYVEGLVDKWYISQADADNESITGLWCEFFYDGKVEIYSALGYAGQTGTYTVNGNRLIIKSAGDTSSLDFSISGTRMTLSNPSPASMLSSFTWGPYLYKKA